MINLLHYEHWTGKQKYFYVLSLVYGFDKVMQGHVTVKLD